MSASDAAPRPEHLIMGNANDWLDMLDERLAAQETDGWWKPANRRCSMTVDRCRCNPETSNGGSSTWCERCEKPKGFAAGAPLAASGPQ